MIFDPKTLRAFIIMFRGNSHCSQKQSKSYDTRRPIWSIIAVPPANTNSFAKALSC